MHEERMQTGVFVVRPFLELKRFRIRFIWSKKTSKTCGSGLEPIASLISIDHEGDQYLPGAVI